MTNKRPESSPDSPVNTPASTEHSTEPLGLKRRHFMGAALALDAAALLAACGGGGGGDSGNTSGSCSGSSSASSSGSSSGSSSASGSASSSASSSASGSSSGSASGSGSASAAPTQWVVSTWAGTGTASFTDGTGSTAAFNAPYGIAMDRSGHLYVGDYNNHRIRKITPAGVVSTLAGSGATGFNDGTGGGATFHLPSGVALDSSGNVYVADYNNHLIRKVSPAGVVTRLAGAGTYGNVNGSAATAKFDSPYGVAVDTSGNVYVADESNHQIRKITPEGMVSTLAGMGAVGFEDGTGISAKFNYPSGVALDTNGNLYVADASNNRIRKITQAGVVSTLAGMGSSGVVNGAGVTATFGNPSGVALDNNGNVYVADYNNHLIRMISPAGVVSTLAGVQLVGHLDGSGVTAKFNYPSGVALDTSGNVYVADSNNHRIRKITPIF